MSTGEQGGSVPKLIAPAKFWLKSALLVVVVGILLAWAWVPSRPEEPVYQGKPLGEWLRIYNESHDGSEVEKQAEAAIRNIGTNGIPALFRMIRTSESGFRTMLKGWVGRRSLFKFNLPDAEDIREMAVFGFKALGENAKGAVPELLTLLKKTGSTNGREEIIDALGAIGPSAQAAVPALLAIASDAKDPERYEAIRALGVIRSSADSVVPFLTSCLRDPEASIRWTAASALCNFGDSAQSSVPTLIPLLADPSEIVRNEATNALKRIDPAAAIKAGIP